MSEITLNKNLSLLVLAEATKGKTFSIRNTTQLGKVFHINCDAKALPFKRNPSIKSVVPNHPLEVIPYLEAAISSPEVALIVFDTITQAAADYVNKVVMPADDGRSAWGEMKKYLMDITDICRKSDKPVIMMAHEQAELNETTGIVDHSAPFQGGFAKIGLEAGYSHIVGCRVIRPSELLPTQMNDLLTITDAEKEEDLKYVFQTRISKTTRGCRYRFPAGVFAPNEMYIDNDVNLILKRLNDFHNT